MKQSRMYDQRGEARLSRSFLRRSARLASASAVIAIAILLAAVVAGCGGSSKEGDRTKAAPGAQRASSADVPEVSWGLNASIKALNIHTAPDFTSVQLLANVLQGLLRYDKDGALHPSLANDWRQVSPVEYRYTLKHGVRFSDGSPVQVEDVLYSMRFAMSPKTGGAASSFYLSVKSIEQSGPNEIKVTLRKPDVVWKYTPGYFSGWVYKKDAAVRAGSNFGGPNGIPIGSGPYKITEFSSDRVTFVRNPYYKGPRPKVGTVVVRLVRDDATRLAAMQSGDIDGTFLVPPGDTPQWEQLPSVQLYSVKSSNTTYTFFNTTKAPFDDVHVRRAFMYAWDRESVVKKLLHGNARVADALVPPELWVNEGLTADEVMARSDELGAKYPFDMAKAKAELAASKYAGGFSTTVKYTATSAEVGTGLQVLAQSLKKLNIDLKLQLISDAQFGELFVPNPDFEMTAGPGAADFPDPLSLMGGMHCSCQAVPNGYNLSGHKSPELDALILGAARNTDETSRVKQIMQAQAIANRDVPAAVVWWDNTIAAVNKKLVLADYGVWTGFVTPWMTNIRAAESK